MYINDNDIPKLLGSLLINHNETNFRIFFTDDRITYFTCNTSGHSVLLCKKYIKNIENIISTNQSTSTTNGNNNSILHTELIEETLTHPDTNFDENTTEINIDNIETTGVTNTNLKRPASLTTASSNTPSPSYNSSQENNTSFKPPKKVLLVEDKTDVNLPSTIENRSSSNSRN